MNLKISKMRREAGIFAAAAPGGRAQLSMVLFVFLFRGFYAGCNRSLSPPMSLRGKGSLNKGNYPSAHTKGAIAKYRLRSGDASRRNNPTNRLTKHSWAAIQRINPQRRNQVEALAPSTIHVVGGRVPLLTQGDGGDRRSLFGHITRFDIRISIIVR